MTDATTASGDMKGCVRILYHLFYDVKQPTRVVDAFVKILSSRRDGIRYFWVMERGIVGCHLPTLASPSTGSATRNRIPHGDARSLRSGLVVWVSGCEHYLRVLGDILCEIDLVEMMTRYRACSVADTGDRSWQG